MAIEKAKVIARIKALFPKTNLTQKRMDAIAAKLTEKLEDEADDTAIDAAITDFNENSVVSIEELAKTDDRLRTLAKKAATTEVGKGKGQTEGEEGEGDEPDEPDDPMAALLKEIRSVKSELSELKQKETKKTLEERFKSDERVKGIPSEMFRGYLPNSEDDFETSVEELVTAWESVSGTVNKNAEKEKIGVFASSAAAPPAGGGKGGKAVATEVTDAVAKRLL